MSVPSANFCVVCFYCFTSDKMAKTATKKAMKKTMKKTMKKAMKKAMKKSMKKAMKKAMKAKRLSKIARGRGAKSKVYNGKKEKTVGGLTKSDLTKNKFGKVVSKKASDRAKGNAFPQAVRKARTKLNVTGFCAIGGTSLISLLVTSKASYDKSALIGESRALEGRPVASPLY